MPASSQGPEPETVVAPKFDPMTSAIDLCKYEMTMAADPWLTTSLLNSRFAYLSDGEYES